MKTMKILALSAMAAAAMAWQARADLAWIDDGGNPGVVLPNNPSSVLAVLEGLAGVPDDLVYLGDGNVVGDQGSGGVSWGVVGSLVTYISIKQGTLTYFFSVIGTQQEGSSATISYLNSLIPGTANDINGVSNIRMFGGPGGSVPDGGLTAILLGLGLSALGLVRRGQKA
jgi:hypothetical protein